MKTMLFLIFSVIACASAAPDCSIEKYSACSRDLDLEHPPLTSEELDKYCSVVTSIFPCLIDMSERCPDAPFARFLKYTKDAERKTNDVCDKNGSLRKKYLENSSCLYYVAKNITDYCEASLIKGSTKEERCRNLRRFFKCHEDTIGGVCGQDALEFLISTQDQEMALELEGCL